MTKRSTTAETGGAGEVHAAGHSGLTERLGFGKLLAWSSSHLSQAANFLILGYFAIYCTDTLGLNPALVGVLLLVSKIADAVGVLLAGYVVDISPQTRWGKARPYDLAIIGIWIFTAIMFATPGTLGDTAKYVWVFVSYLLITAIFTPLFSANQPLFMARVFRTRDGYSKASSRAGVVIGFGSIITAILFPIFAQTAGKSTSAWAILGLGFAIPGVIIGVVRFLAIREVVETEKVELPRVTVRDIRTVLGSNPYLWAVAGIQFVVAIVGNVGAATYYFRYIVGNLALIGALAGLNILILPLLIAAPALIRRFSVSRLIAITALMGAVGALIYSFAGANIVLIVIGGLLVNLGAVPSAFLLPILIIDNATYNEWRGNRRLESVGGGITAFAMSLGAGVAAALAGFVLSAGGYDGSKSIQSASATTAIIALMSWIPAGLSIISAIIAFAYQRMEKQLPAITASIAIARDQAASSVVGAGAPATGTATTKEAIDTIVLGQDKEE